jgi:uncharacterized membrane protein YedE/YeeE
MMEMAEYIALENTVLALAFVLSLMFGAIAQRTSFCTMGAVSDVYNMGSWTRMRVWGMAAGVAMLGFGLLSYLGLIRSADTIYSAGSLNWLAAVGGGLLFGFGMVLASGCANKTLIRIGEGNLKSVVVFIMIALGATSAMWGLSSVLYSFAVDHGTRFTENGTLVSAWIAPSAGLDTDTVGLVLAVMIGGGLTAWALASKKFRSSANNLLAGAGIGLLVVGMWWVIGHLGYVEVHPDTLDTVYAGTAAGGMQSFSFTSPIARSLYLLTMTDPTRPLLISVGVLTVLGVIIGSFLHAIYSRTFQWEGLHGEQDTALHMIGGVCMGVGGVVAGGCTVGQGLSGVSTLSGESLIAVMGIMLGGVAGLRLQMWLLMRNE